MLYSTQETYDMLQRILDHESSLNAWESGFIDDMTLSVDSREDIQYLTAGAREKIAQIYDTRVKRL